MKTKITLIALIFASLFAFTDVQAQRCGIVNTAFAPGERIEYDLFFTMGIIRARAGRGSITIQESTFQGQPAYRAQMTVGTTGAANVIQTFTETSTSYLDKSFRPLQYSRETHERSHIVETIDFTHSDDQINIRSVRYINNEQRFDYSFIADACTFDNFSILLFVRNMDFSSMNVGDRKHVQFVTGRRLSNMYINFLGISTMRINGNRQEVYNISMTIFEEAFTSPSDAISASITRDANRIPVEINTHLRVGAVRMVMRNASGLRH